MNAACWTLTIEPDDGAIEMHRGLTAAEVSAAIAAREGQAVADRVLPALVDGLPYETAAAVYALHTGRAVVSTLDLYHRTAPEQAAQIRDAGRWLSRENTRDVYFSDRPDGHAVGYGSALVHVRVPADLAHLEDEFPDGERHYRVSADMLRPEHLVPPNVARELFEQMAALAVEFDHAADKMREGLDQDENTGPAEEIADEIAKVYEEAHQRIADVLNGSPLADTEGSASSQHYIETGIRLPYGGEEEV